MKKTAFALGTLALILIAGLALANDRSKGAETTKFTGTYDWSDGDVGSLTATFEPAGENSWTVTYDFFWNGKDHTWTGTAEGSLADGTEVTGTATSGSRDWVFEATIEDGVMQGSHREIREGRDPYESGTFEIERS